MRTGTGFHCSHEQFSPSEMLDLAVKARQRGFRQISCSDHLAPWSESQGRK